MFERSSWQLKNTRPEAGYFISMFTLRVAEPADAELKRLEGLAGEAGRVKQIKKALGNLAKDPRHPSLQTHKFSGLPNPYKEDDPALTT